MNQLNTYHGVTNIKSTSTKFAVSSSASYIKNNIFFCDFVLL